MKHIKKFESVDHFDVDPWGEENWESVESNFLHWLKNRVPQDRWDILVTINISGSDLKSFKGIEKLTQLRQLICNGMRIGNLEEITNCCHRLRILECSDNGLNSLRGLQNKVLEFLNASHNNLTDLNHLYMGNMRDLMVDHNRLTEIPRDLYRIRSLDLSNNRISSLKGIEYSTNLNTLRISNNLLTNLRGIENLENLRYLYISGNLLKNINLIKNLKKLETLNCRNNKFSKMYKLFLKAYCKLKNITLYIDL